MPVNYEEIDDLIQTVLTTKAKTVKDQLIACGANAVPSLCEVLEAAPEQSKWVIISILSKIKDPRAMPVIAKFLYSDNQAIQAVIAQYLGDSGDPAAVPFLLDALEVMTESSTVIWVVGALGKLKDRRAVLPLMHVLRDTTSPVVRYTAIAALGAIGDPQAAPLISTYKDDANHHVREHAQNAMVLLNQEEPV